MVDVETAYQATLDFLYQFVDHSLTRNLTFSEEAFNLNRMRNLVKALGSPEEKFPAVHIAGTKGKGSTGAMIEAALRAAGYKVGFYTSPHLIDFNERIQINRQPISHKQLVDLVELIRGVIAIHADISTFDLTTALAFLHFARQEVDIAVLEVGLGGRLDSTNVISPLVSVITSLSMDHMKVLGDTLAKISFEKAGIIKAGKPVVVSPQKAEALEVIRKVAAERGADLTVSAEVYPSRLIEHNLEKQKFSIRTASGVEEEFTIPLLGRHQIENAVTAYASLQVLNENGFAISTDAIRTGFAAVDWPGRFEVLSNKPMVIIDSAHNRDLAIKLAQAIRDYLGDRKIVLVFGASEDKDVAGMFAELLPLTQAVVFTQSIHPRSFQADGLLEIANQYSGNVSAIVPLEDALARGLEMLDEQSALIVTGSIFVAAGAEIFLPELIRNRFA